MTDRVLAVASGGGHWEQLMLLAEAFAGHDLVYAKCGPIDGHDRSLYRLPDCNRKQPLRAAWCMVRALVLVLRLRPDAIVSTGAAPGLLVLLAGRLVGARTMWIDSIANSERLSRSGWLAQRIAHRCLTQWPHLARAGGPQFAGAVL